MTGSVWDGGVSRVRGPWCCRWEALVAQPCPTLCNLVDCRLLCPWDSPGKNTGVACHFPLQGIFPIQGSNPGLLHWTPEDSLPSELPGKPMYKDLRVLNSGYKFSHFSFWSGVLNTQVFCLLSLVSWQREVSTDNLVVERGISTDSVERNQAISTQV